MADDVEIGVDGSGAEVGVKKIVQTLERIASASERVASESSKSLDAMYNRLVQLGNNNVASKYERMAGAMERATVRTAASVSSLNNIVNQTSRGGQGLARLTDNLSKLSSFKGPNASAVSNTERLMATVTGARISSTLNNLGALNNLAGYRGPSAASVTNTTALLEALTSIKVPASIGRLSVLADLSGYRGPSARSVQNTVDLIQALSKIRFADAGGVTSVLSQLNGAGARLGSTGAAARVAGDQLGRLNTQSRTAAGGLGSLAGSADKLNQSLFHTQRFFGTIANVAGLSFVAGEIQKFDAASASLQAVNKNISATTTEMSYLTDISQKYGVYLGNLTQGWSQFRNAASNANLGLADTKSLFEGITQSSRVFNLSFSDQEGVFRAVTQIMSKGSLQMEELRGQLGERLPIAIQAMANALGVSVSKLGEMTKKAQVVGPVLQKALAGFGPELQRMTSGGLAAAMNTIGATMSSLRTEGMLLSKEMGDAGLTAAIMNVLHAATQLISEGGALRSLLMNAAAAAKFLSENLGATATVGAALLIGKFGILEKVGESLVGSMASVAVSVNAQASSSMRAVIATQALTAALTASSAASAINSSTASANAQANMFRNLSVIEATGSQAALTQATALGVGAAEGSIAATRVLAASLGTISAANLAATQTTIGLTAATAAYGQAAVGVAATSIGTSAALMRVSAGAVSGVTSLKLLQIGAVGAGRAFTGLMTAIGLTNPFVLAIAGAAALTTGLIYFSDAAKEARDAQKNLATATNLASDSMLGASTNIDAAAAAYRAMTADVREQTTALLENNKAQGRSADLKATETLEALRRSKDFQSLGAAGETALNLAQGSTFGKPVDPVSQLQGAQSLEGMLKSKRDEVGSDWLGGLQGRGGTMNRQKTLDAGIASLQTRQKTIPQNAEASALLAMRNLADSKTPVTMENIAKATGYTVETLKQLGIAAPESVKAIESLGKGAKGSHERLIPLTTSLEELVQLAPKYADALRLMQPGVVGQAGSYGIKDDKSQFQDRLEQMNREREATELSSEAWSRYQKSIGKKNSDKGLLFDEARLKGSTAALKIYGEALSGVSLIWESELAKDDAGPFGLDRLRAVREAAREYSGMGSVFIDLANKTSLIREAADRGQIAEGKLGDAIESANRKALLSFSGILGVQGELLSAYDKQAEALRTLNSLAEKFPGLDLSKARAQNARDSAEEIRKIYANSAEGRGASALSEGLASQGQQGAQSADSIFNSTIFQKQYREQVQRPDLERTMGKDNADSYLLSQDKLAANQTAINDYITKIGAIGQAFDSVGDAISNFVQTGTLDIRALATSITAELGKALLIDPLVNSAKNSLANMISSAGSNTLSTVNSAASAASSALGTAATGAVTDAAAMTAALSPAVAALTAAGASVTAGGTTMSGSAVALTGSGTALTAAATTLGGGAAGLTVAATGLNVAAGALGVAASAMMAASAAKTGSSLLKTFTSVAKVAAVVAHTGGVVGSSGLSSRSVSASSFAGAVKYHSGGLAGSKPFKSGEVPAILKRREEVLTEEDPRHINNLSSGVMSRDMASSGSSRTTTNHYDIAVHVQAPTPSGNPQADAAAQQSIAAKAAEALGAVLQSHSDGNKRTRNMQVK